MPQLPPDIVVVALEEERGVASGAGIRGSGMARDFVNASICWCVACCGYNCDPFFAGPFPMIILSTVALRPLELLYLLLRTFQRYSATVSCFKCCKCDLTAVSSRAVSTRRMSWALVPG